MSVSTSAVTVLAPVLEQWKKGGPSFDRTVGATVTIGIAYSVFRLIRKYIRKCRLNEKSYLLEFFVRRFRNLLEISSESQSASSPTEVVHSGACHCRSVLFEFRAPACINARDGKGKIHYPHVRVTACNFRIVDGEDVLKMYYIQVPAGKESSGVEPDLAAFSFCSRCGVHILHAPNPNSTHLDVNVDCLDSDEKRKLVFSDQKLNFSVGVPVVSDEWNEKDELLDEFSEAETSRLITFGHMMNNVAEEGCSSIDENHSLQGSLYERSVSSTPHSFQKVQSNTWHPGTPSTVATNSMDSGHTSRIQPYTLADGGISIDGSETSSMGLRVSTGLTNTLRVTTEDDSPRLTPSTTPMARDQLKYYISKHVSSGKKNSNSKAKKEQKS